MFWRASCRGLRGKGAMAFGLFCLSQRRFIDDMQSKYAFIDDAWTGLARIHDTDIPYPASTCGIFLPNLRMAEI